MARLDLKVLGCGDAFGSGGVANTCFYLQSSGSNLLIDCGATSLVKMKEAGLDSEDIDEILISHFHGDHYGGIPFLLLEAALVKQRSKPLTIYGPAGVEEKVMNLLEAMYPGTSDRRDLLDLHFIPYRADSTLEERNFKLTTKQVVHAPESDPHGLRLEIEGKVLAFSGDTEWTEELIPLAEGADLFICECNFLEQSPGGHLCYRDLQKMAAQLKAKRIVLTHLGPDMVDKKDLEWTSLREGMEISI